jgi:hypothetical protein
MCGRAFSRTRRPESVAAIADPMPGLEPTAFDLAPAAGAAELPVPAPLLELERTMLAPRMLRVEVQPLEVSGSAQEALAPGAPSFWDAAAPDLEPSRSEPDGLRTPAASDDGICPFCGAQGADAVCDNCGRRKRRYGAPAGARPAASDDGVVCPACFSRVAGGPRCLECGVPFPQSLRKEQ